MSAFTLDKRWSRFRRVAFNSTVSKLCFLFRKLFELSGSSAFNACCFMSERMAVAGTQDGCLHKYDLRCTRWAKGRVEPSLNLTMMTELSNVQKETSGIMLSASAPWRWTEPPTEGLSPDNNRTKVNPDIKKKLQSLTRTCFSPNLKGTSFFMLTITARKSFWKSIISSTSRLNNVQRVSLRTLDSFFFSNIAPTRSNHCNLYRATFI